MHHSRRCGAAAAPHLRVTFLGGEKRNGRATKPTKTLPPTHTLQYRSGLMQRCAVQQQQRGLRTFENRKPAMDRCLL